LTPFQLNFHTSYADFNSDVKQQEGSTGGLEVQLEREGEFVPVRLLHAIHSADSRHFNADYRHFNAD